MLANFTTLKHTEVVKIITWYQNLKAGFITFIFFKLYVCLLHILPTKSFLKLEWQENYNFKMKNTSVLIFLALLFYYSNEKLQMTATRFKRGNNQQWVVSCTRISKRAKYLWSILLVVSFVLTSTELYLSIYSTQTKN